MSDDDIPFDKTFDLAPDTAEEVLPGVRRILCNNPGPFTFKGTVSYIVGRGHVAILDPGPIDEPHIAALLDAVRGETVTHIIVTHTHRDHSPAAARIKAATGAKTYGEGPHRPARPPGIGASLPPRSNGDTDFQPDVVVKEGDVVSGDGWALEGIFTPGHCANHMAFALKGTDVLFSGDHVMAWSTPIVAPPDGSMRDYMDSLDKLSRRTEMTYFPGHGGAVRDGPRLVRQYIRHRHAREAMILKLLAGGETDIPALVRKIYIGLDQQLIPAAGRAVLAHLEDLVERGRVVTTSALSLDGRYRLADG